MKVQRSLDYYFAKTKNDLVRGNKKCAPVAVISSDNAQDINSTSIKPREIQLPGQAFYVAQSLPERPDLVALIIEHGGKVVHKLGANVVYIVEDVPLKAISIECGFSLMRVEQLLKTLRSTKTKQHSVDHGTDVLDLCSSSEEIMVDVDIVPQMFEQPRSPLPLAGFNFYVMKSLKVLKPHECVDQLQSHGGLVMNRIGRGLNYIVVSQRGALLLGKVAHECGIELLHEDKFPEFLEQKQQNG